MLAFTEISIRILFRWPEPAQSILHDAFPGSIFPRVLWKGRPRRKPLVEFARLNSANHGRYLIREIRKKLILMLLQDLIRRKMQFSTLFSLPRPVFRQIHF
jgi:hypothetical protein